MLAIVASARGRPTVGEEDYSQHCVRTHSRFPHEVEAELEKLTACVKPGSSSDWPGLCSKLCARDALVAHGYRAAVEISWSIKT